jgi:uncharacterized membrane protein YgdD (TMEM256/DUF423 family)
MNWLTLGALLAALGVAIGAFGAHALPGYLEGAGRTAEEIVRGREIFETAVRYQMYHALALVLLGILARVQPTGSYNLAGVLFIAGVAIFSGLLYALVLTNLKWLGAIVPLGGLSMIAGWLALAWSTIRS